jgi:hypothetical protein
VDGTSQLRIVNNRLVKPIIVIVAQSDFRSNATVFIQLDNISRKLVAISPSILFHLFDQQRQKGITISVTRAVLRLTSFTVNIPTVRFTSDHCGQEDFTDCKRQNYQSHKSATRYYKELTPCLLWVLLTDTQISPKAHYNSATTKVFMFSKLVSF